MRCRALRELGQLVAGGMTYDVIAKAAGTSRATVCRWFQGLRPRLSHRIRLRDQLGIAVLWWQSDEWFAKHGSTPNIEAALAEAS
ncbi:MAG TPA: helix-turn-helix domain-containing protein [Polyangiaceae bacterium]|jgi:transcriptional regulator with XRE-family HTH domain